MRHPDPNFLYPSRSFFEHELVHDRSRHPSFKPFMRRGSLVLGTHIDALNWDEAISRIVNWAEHHQSRYVALCNVHSVVTATQDAAFQDVLSHADMALPDGAPVVWTMRREGHEEQQRLSGPDLMWRYLAVAEKLGQSVFFYGSTEDTLNKLRANMAQHFPALKIAGMMSPPFRELTAEEDQSHVDQINRSGANTVFVSLGCPKQEAWMANHHGRIQAVMIGVGAAFGYHAGTIHRAPTWMQKIGMEWFHRLCSEPRRLFKRYAITNSVFVFHTIKRMVFGAPKTTSPHGRGS